MAINKADYVNPETNNVMASDELITDIIDALNDITTPIVTTYSPVSPTTGTIQLIRQGDIVYMSGNIIVATSGNRIANIPAELCPKEAVTIHRSAGGNIQISTSGPVVGWFSGGATLDGISWSIGNK